MEGRTITLLTVCLIMMAVSVQGDCEYEGQTYTAGETYTVDCNTCTCNEDGSSSCTEIGCPVPGCSYGGKSRAVADSFPSDDGCNTCMCESDGMVSCTEHACKLCTLKTGEIVPHGDHTNKADPCNLCSCRNGQFVCTLVACAQYSAAGGLSASTGIIALLIATLMLIYQSLGHPKHRSCLD